MRRTDDKSSWLGSAPAGCVFPEGNKKKMFQEGEGAGELKNYVDTAEEIKKEQDMAKGKAKEYSQKPYHRN